MPKGGDLHNHLSGAVPTETLIALAVEDGLCIDVVDADGDARARRRRRRLPGRPARRRRLGHRHRLLRPDPAGMVDGGLRRRRRDRPRPLLRDVRQVRPGDEPQGRHAGAVAHINAAQNVLYLETLVSRQGDAVRALAKRSASTRLRGHARQLLATRHGGVVDGASAETDADDERFDELLGCRTARPQPGCALTLRYDYQVGRATDPEIVFANLLLGFELQRSDPRYVGVNLVQPEDDPIALRDYTLHMRMIRYLRDVYAGPRDAARRRDRARPRRARRPALPHPPGRRDRGRRAHRPRRRPRPRDRLPRPAARRWPAATCSSRRR